MFKPTIVVSVPRVFEKVYNTAEQNAASDGKGKIFASAAKTAIEYSEALDRGGPGLLLKLKHAVFDKLVYGKLRAALGGDCYRVDLRRRTARRAALPLLPRRRPHHLRGLRPDRDQRRHHRQPGGRHEGRLGRKAAARQQHANRRRRRAADRAAAWCSTATGSNETASAEAIEDGWFHTGDLGAVDSDGFLTIIGRKKEIIVTAGGKNVAPAVLEDQLRAHPLISQAMAVGDAKPFIGALITIDPEAFDGWKQRNGKSASASVGELATDPDLLAEIDGAVKHANQAVSHAEAIRKFRILPVDFTEDTGELTPTLKVKRKVVAEKFADEIEALYRKD